MATEERRAPRVPRGRELAPIITQPVSPAGFDHLAIFDSIRRGFGVLPVHTDEARPIFAAGDVAVYDEGDLFRNDLFDGGLYVIEYQSPRAGMSEELAARIGSVRRAVTRRMVRAVRSARNSSLWMAQPIRNAAVIAGVRSFICSDGPYEEFQLTDKLIGKIVGIYCPAALAVSS